MDNFCDVVDALEAQGIEKHMDVSPISPHKEPVIDSPV